LFAASLSPADASDDPNANAFASPAKPGHHIRHILLYSSIRSPIRINTKTGFPLIWKVGENFVLSSFYFRSCISVSIIIANTAKELCESKLAAAKYLFCISGCAVRTISEQNPDNQRRRHVIAHAPVQFAQPVFLIALPVAVPVF